MLGKSFPGRTFVITFDDGYKNNYEIALPVLKAFGFTATIFIPTEFVGKKATWKKKQDVPDFSLLSWREIEEMSQQDIDFQPHGSTHACLLPLALKDIESEIVQSKAEIEKRIGKQADVFCYPYGKFDERVVSLLKSMGFRGAVTAKFGVKQQGDLFRLNRLAGDRLRNILSFRAALAGKYEPYFRLKVVASRLLNRST
jgi:peptidoglycan/xylan/chitin deacetylase (PgdA/CDA1 family)